MRNEPHIHKVQNPGHIKGGPRAYKLHNHFPIFNLFYKGKKSGDALEEKSKMKMTQQLTL